MGSLMAGWDSPTSDPNTENFERNKSFTKEEIENFWQSQKPSQQQQHQHEEEEQQQQQQQFVSGEKPESACLVPRFIFQGTKCAVDLEKARNTNDWWARSNWAFLNEPPHEEMNKSATTKYAAQFHVAEQFPKNK